MIFVTPSVTPINCFSGSLMLGFRCVSSHGHLGVILEQIFHRWGVMYLKSLCSGNTAPSAPSTLNTWTELNAQFAQCIKQRQHVTMVTFELTFHFGEETRSQMWQARRVMSDNFVDGRPPSCHLFGLFGLFSKSPHWQSDPEGQIHAAGPCDYLTKWSFPCHAPVKMHLILSWILQRLLFRFWAVGSSET